MTTEAANSPVGSRGLLFNPNMAGGTSMSPSINIRGAFLNLDLGHTRADMIRAAMEGIALELRLALDKLRQMETFSEEMLVVGGGSRSLVWQQIYADVFNTTIVRTNIDQQAAALGAAACAAVGTGLWNFEFIDEIHIVKDKIRSVHEHIVVYEELLLVYQQAGRYLSDLGDLMIALDFNK
jgi:xylulokinase